MSVRPNSLVLFLVLLLVSSLFSIIEARSLNAAKHHISIDTEFEEVFDGSYIEDVETRGLRGEIKKSGGISGLYIEAIKIGGPSSGGKGYEPPVTNVQSPVKIVESGPSPGDGN